MSEELRLDPPFYLPEAVERFVATVLPGTVNTIPLEALSDPRVAEALNAALRLSVEHCP